MERGNRLLLFAGICAVPAVFLLGMLFFQLKRVDILTRNTEAELQLARQKQDRMESLREELDESPIAAAPAPEPPKVSDAAGPSE